MINLSNLCIMSTRPGIQSEELCRLIKVCGGKAVNFPTIIFAPPQDKNAYQQAVKELGEHEWLIFISPQAVYASISDIRQQWPQFSPRVKFTAVGEGTAKVLQEAGYQLAAFPATEWSSEGLLDLPEFQTHAITGKHIAIIRGEDGRELIDKTLGARGAHVMPVIAYRRMLPDIDVTEYLNMLKQRIIDVIVCASFEGVRNLKILMGERGWPYLKSVPMIVVSQRIKVLAEDLGFQTIWAARNASHKAILELLAEMRK